MKKLNFSQNVFWGIFIILLAVGLLYLKGNIYYDFAGVETIVDTEIFKVIEIHNFFISIVVSFLIALMCAYISAVKICYNYVAEKTIGFFKWIVGNKKKVLLNAIALLFLAILAIGSSLVFQKAKDFDTYNPYVAYIIFGVFVVLFYAFKCRKTVHQYLHQYFFVMLMLVGTIHILIAPPLVGISWDDAIHYDKAAYISWEHKGQVAMLDDLQEYNHANFIAFEYGYTAEDRQEWKEFTDANDDQYTLVDVEYSMGLKCIAYIPSGIALAVGRGLGLSYIATYMFGKWISLLCYAIISSISIKILRDRGKILIATISMIPTLMFMASSYSYDGWVCAFIILGYAILFGTIQRGEKISLKRQLLATILLVIGIVPKAIYFPILLPLLFVKKQHYQMPAKSRCIALIAMLFLMSTFLLPLFINGAGEGDLRGGAGVNSTEQISFMIANVTTYAKILLRFLAGYLSSDASVGYLTLMANYGQANYFTVCVIVVIIAAIIDNRMYSEKEDVGRFFKIVVLFGAFVAMALSATALYISFTAVGSPTIAGCQPRYILPVLFIVVYVLSEMKLELSQKIKNNGFMLCTSSMALIFLYALYDLCIAYY